MMKLSPEICCFQRFCLESNERVGNYVVLGNVYDQRTMEMFLSYMVQDDALAKEKRNPNIWGTDPATGNDQPQPTSNLMPGQRISEVLIKNVKDSTVCVMGVTGNDFRQSLDGRSKAIPVDIMDSVEYVKRVIHNYESYCDLVVLLML